MKTKPKKRQKWAFKTRSLKNVKILDSYPDRPNRPLKTQQETTSE
jgi:hypothetical protein